DSSASDVVDPSDVGWLDSVLPIVMTVIVSLLALALLVLPLLVFPVLKAVRRRWRRTTTTPEVAMVGAWHELVDHYIDFRQEVPRGLTRTETADALRQSSALELAELTDRAVFAEHAPTADENMESWRLVDAERRRLATEAGFWARIRAFLTPASL